MTRTFTRLLVVMLVFTAGCTMDAHRSGFAGDGRRTSDVQFAKRADVAVDRAGLPASTRPTALRPWDGQLLTPDEYDRATAGTDATGTAARDASARPAR